MKKSFWQMLKKTSLIGVGALIGNGISDWIGKNEFSWEQWLTRIITMAIVCIVFGFIEYKLQK